MVKKSKPIVVWNNRAIEQFRITYEWIKRDSLTNAERVKTGIIKLIESIPDNPEKFPPDKFKKNNKGNYRAFEKFSFRISYKHSPKEIIILRFRHVKQEPKLY